MSNVQCPTSNVHKQCVKERITSHSPVSHTIYKSSSSSLSYRPYRDESLESCIIWFLSGLLDSGVTMQITSRRKESRYIKNLHVETKGVLSLVTFWIIRLQGKHNFFLIRISPFREFNWTLERDFLATQNDSVPTLIITLMVVFMTSIFDCVVTHKRNVYTFSKS